MIMTHGDDNGMIMPPRLAPSHCAILPIIRNDDERATILGYCDEIKDQLQDRNYHDSPIRVEVDARDINAGEKGWQWVKKGIPVTAEVGPREVSEGNVFVARRDKSRKERFSQTRDAFCAEMAGLLDDIQADLLARAREFRDSHSRVIEDGSEFQAFFTPERTDKPEIHGGFTTSPWCGSAECEARVNTELGASIRCIPLDSEESNTPCVSCGNNGSKPVIFAKAY
jgi:prolyl-tRNA synthetase